MNKYKVVVYSICKNEEKFIKKWYNSMKEADQIVVLDTGSTDNSVKLFNDLGIKVVSEIIVPWRFDVARNKSLDLVDKDTDICVCTDLDEIFLPGWRQTLEDLWDKNKINRLYYLYNWSLDQNNKPIVSFYMSKIHSRNSYIWTHPVHEVLTNIDDNEKSINTDSIVLNHYPDKNKSRSSYLPLLELSVKEDPEDDRNMHYLGREYMYHKRWNDAIDILIKHLSLEKATWKDERCASMRFISRCYFNLKRYEEALMWINKAIKEAPYLRDPYVEKAILESNLENHEEVINNCNLALKITHHEKTYINEVFSYNETIYDLLSVAYFYKGNLDKSLEMVNKALEINPNNKRIISNKIIITNKFKDL